MMGVDKPEIVTPLYFDMVICMDLLHCTHNDFLALPAVERKKCRYFLVTKSQKDKKELDDMPSSSHGINGPETLPIVKVRS